MIAAFKGEHLDRATFDHPFLLDGEHPRQVLGTVATYVTADAGTGAVHTAPAHGVDDFATGQRYSLPEIQYVDDAGRQMGTDRFGAGAPQPYEGLTVFKSNPVIIELLKQHHALLGAATLEHSYPHCWRCHNPVITRATEQWFISMETPMPEPASPSDSPSDATTSNIVILSEAKDPLSPEAPQTPTTTFRQRALEEIQRVTWDPSWGKERITNMVATRPDWCISRQRIWGVPIAVFLCRKCGEPLKNPAVNKSIVDLFTRDSADAWYNSRKHPGKAPAPQHNLPRLRPPRVPQRDGHPGRLVRVRRLLPRRPRLRPRHPADFLAPIPAPTSTPKAATSTAAGSCPRSSARSASTTAPRSKL